MSELESMSTNLRLPVPDHYKGSELRLNSVAGILKNRKLLTTCDNCRRKKRGDGTGVPGSTCSNCQRLSADCGYRFPVNLRYQKRGSRAYVEDLEIRAVNAEKLLHLLLPGVDLLTVLDLDLERGGPSNQSSSPVFIPQRLDTLEEHESSLSEDDGDYEDILNLGEPKYVGKSSEFKLVRFAINAKESLVGKHPASSNLQLCLRDEFWKPHEWMNPIREPHLVTCNFPEPDLLVSLVDLYFIHVNAFYPIIHRPTLERNIAQNLHQRDAPFAIIVLFICAISVRFSDDERLQVPWSFDDPRSPGWIWFYKAEEMQGTLLSQPSLHDLQGCCLSAIFLESASPDHGRWTKLGAAIRLALNVGIHRKRRYAANPTVEEELWKRAFWALLLMDRTYSDLLGRQCALQEEDFDLGLPTECDDEYWETEKPEDSFKQPSDQPSGVSYFVWNIKISNLIALANRKANSLKLYKRNAVLDEKTAQWMQSAADSWESSLPDHLRWDPNCQNSLHYQQAVILRTRYDLLQLVIHRPFVRRGRLLPSSMSVNALSIATRAARDCCRVVYVARHRLEKSLRICSKASFTAAVHLLTHMWNGNPEFGHMADLQEVHYSIEVLGMVEKSFHAAGRLRDILHGILAGHDSYANIYGSPPIPTELGRNEAIPSLAANQPSFDDLDADLESLINPILYGTSYSLPEDPNYGAKQGVTARQLPTLSASYWMGLDQLAELAPDGSEAEQFNGWFEDWCNAVDP